MGVITHTLARIYKGTHPFNANLKIYVGKVQVFDEKYFFKLQTINCQVVFCWSSLYNKFIEKKKNKISKTALFFHFFGKKSQISQIIKKYERKVLNH